MSFRFNLVEKEIELAMWYGKCFHPSAHRHSITQRLHTHDGQLNDIDNYIQTSIVINDYTLFIRWISSNLKLSLENMLQEGIFQR